MLSMQNAGEWQRAHHEYMESRVLAAPPVVLVEILYQVSVSALERAIGHLKSGDAMARSREITRAQEAVNQLMLALDPSADASFTPALAALYAYIQDETLKGHVRCSEESLQNALSVLKTLLEAWSGVCGQLTGPHADPERSEDPAFEASADGASDQDSAYRSELEPASRDWHC